jgi:hypothetical protein
MDWKTANVTPIFKKDVKADPGNYRPVSLTSVCCKLLESVIRDDLMEHLLSDNLMRESQHGFMARKSCTTNLLEFLETLMRSVDEGNAMDVIFLDFAMAFFDKVLHRRLLVQLEAHDIKGKVLRWIWRLSVRKKAKSGYKQIELRVGEYCLEYLRGQSQDLSYFWYSSITWTQWLTWALKSISLQMLAQEIKSSADNEHLQSSLDRMTEWAETCGECRSM